MKECILIADGIRSPEICEANIKVLNRRLVYLVLRKFSY